MSYSSSSTRTTYVRTIRISHELSTFSRCFFANLLWICSIYLYFGAEKMQQIHATFIRTIHTPAFLEFTSIAMRIPPSSSSSIWRGIIFFVPPIIPFTVFIVLLLFRYLLSFVRTHTRSTTDCLLKMLNRRETLACSPNNSISMSNCL